MIDATFLLARRTERGLSQRGLARLVGVNAMTIHRIEHGSDTSALSLAVLGRLADALDVDPADLLLGRPATGANTVPPPANLDPVPLDHNAARLLRRIHRGDDIRRTMTRAEREITLPELINRCLVQMGPNGAVVEPAVSAHLALPSRPTSHSHGSTWRAADGSPRPAGTPLRRLGS